MWRSVRYALFLIVVLFHGLSDCSAGDENQPTFKIATRRDNDKVTVQIEQNTTVLSIQSPAGISQAVIERAQAKWPERVVLRLHLKGLESFRASNGKVAIHAAVSSHDDNRRVRVWMEGKEDSPLDSTSPLWTEIRLLGSDGKPVNSIPLKDGYFEVQLPKMFFAGEGKSMTLEWIDFYRN